MIDLDRKYQYRIVNNDIDLQYYVYLWMYDIRQKLKI